MTAYSCDVRCGQQILNCRRARMLAPVSERARMQDRGEPRASDAAVPGRSGVIIRPHEVCPHWRSIQVHFRRGPRRHTVSICKCSCWPVPTESRTRRGCNSARARATRRKRSLEPTPTTPMMTATMGFRRRQSSRMPASCAASRLRGHATQVGPRRRRSAPGKSSGVLRIILIVLAAILGLVSVWVGLFVVLFRLLDSYTKRPDQGSGRRR
jgi:hypothetical protein